MAKIMIAMSGGVDSSLAAALLREAGHDVTGVTMHLWEGDDERLKESLCCSQEIAESARRVCAQLGIAYYVFNYQREFRKHVIEYFLREYAQGYTPNPCLACNRDIKFRALLARAEALGFDYVATGHYARIQPSPLSVVRGQLQPSPLSVVRGQLQEDADDRPPTTDHRPPTDDQRPTTDDRRQGDKETRRQGESKTVQSAICNLQSAISESNGQRTTDNGRYTLLRAVDRDKDQSYMLHMLQQPELARLLFPIGDYSKSEVRAMAAQRGLASADRPESQDICFVPGGDYRNLLREEQPESLRRGPIVDLQGHEIGQHAGLPLYTIGQRKGLGIAAGQPLYVTRLDVARNALVVGPREALERAWLEASAVSFVGGDWPAAPFDCQAQIRSHAEPVQARVTPGAHGSLRVEFAHPQRAITPGQAVVLYDGEIVLGGGRISA